MFLGAGTDFWIWEAPPDGSESSHHHPPHLHLLLRLAQVSVTPHRCDIGIYPKKHTKSHLFHHHLKEREGNLCKVFKGAGQWWWLHRHGPSPKFHQNPGDHCSICGEQRGCQTNSGNSSHEKQSNREKTFPSDRCLHLISREHRELPPE